MEISQRSINALERVITGNETPTGQLLAPYRSGPMLVEFFNEFGRNDVYGNGFPSRHVYVKDVLRSYQGSDDLRKILESALDPAHFVDFEGGVEAAVEYANKYLAFDDYKLELDRSGKRYRVTRHGVHMVEVESQEFSDDPLTREFIEEQIYKSYEKVRSEDYDGAITNARSLLESVLSEIENRLDNDPPKPDGDLGKLFKRVQRLLNLEPSRNDIAEPLKQVLRGLAGIVNGIAPIRNKMSDAHARSFKPVRHHAKFAVNAASTACDFLLDTYQYQMKMGKLQPVG